MIAQQKGWKIIKTRWIDINKGDDDNPVYPSRVVGKEFNNGEMDGLFAGTPPLEAMRYIIHEAATVEHGQDIDSKVLMINDVARAFFEAEATRPICVELPEESLTDDDRNQGMVGLLKMSLYGTRDAATNWQKEVAKEMKAWGFERGLYNPCLYWHAKWKVQTLVHGDDFLSVGCREHIQEFKKKLQRRFAIKTNILGRKEGQEREGRVLNRIVRVGEDGWEYEPDQRHAELIVEAMGMSDAKGITTPGEDEKAWEAEENDEEVKNDQATLFRKTAARANYLSSDRPDIMYSVKELCRHMAKPTVGAWKRLKRLARY